MSEQKRCPTKALVIDRENAHRGYWLVTVPQTHTPEDAQHPDYFGFHALSLNVGDLIEVAAEDQSWYAELWVRAKPAGTNQVRTVLRQPITYFDTEELPEGWSIQYLGVSGKHTVFNGAEIAEGGFETREEATIAALGFAGRAAKAVATPVEAAKRPGRKPAEKPADSVKADAVT